MKPFERAYVPPEEREIFLRDFLRRWQAGDPTLREFFPGLSSPEAVKAALCEAWKEEDRAEVYRNDVYQVAIYRDAPGVAHLSIKRIDRQCIHDWRDLQEIKNLLVGPECEAVELYPAESRVVDTANQYHLWCSTDPAFRFPLGFDSGRHVDDQPLGKSVNRPINHR